MNAFRFNPWPVSIISFFSVAILGCATFVTFCSRHPADLISPNYYEEEVRYQGQIDRQQQTQAQAPLASVRYDRAAKCLSLSVPVIMAAAKPAGQIQLYRPSAMNLDRTIKLDLTPSGSQMIDATSLVPGLWKVRVSWNLHEQQYFIDQKIVIPTEAAQ
jgi:nitrogen fixation protein FixH